MSSPVISISGLGKRYVIGARRDNHGTFGEAVAAWFRRERGPSNQQPFWALRDVSFDVHPGDVIGIVGRNGAGKSTLLKIISRITLPSEGTVRLVGRVGSLLEVGTGFHPELTGRENVYLSGAILGMRRDEVRKRFDEIVAFAEVEQFLDTPTKRYSSGMYARLAFSVAAHLESDILIVDEVLAVGDANFQRKCLTRMSEVGVAGRTVLFVSHNLPAVARLCTRAVLVEQGRVLLDGTTTEVLETYVNKLASSAAYSEWTPDTAPGSEGVRLLSVHLRTEDGSLAATAHVDQALHLVLRYEVQATHTFRCSASFSTQGVVAFTSIEPRETARTPGFYESTLVVPANLLSEGEHVVSVALFTSRGVKQRLAAGLEAVTFLVSDPMHGSSARGDYAERIDGVVRPRLDWKMMSIAAPRLSTISPLKRAAGKQ